MDFYLLPTQISIVLFARIRAIRGWKFFHFDIIHTSFTDAVADK